MAGSFCLSAHRKKREGREDEKRGRMTSATAVVGTRSARCPFRKERRREVGRSGVVAAGSRSDRAKTLSKTVSEPGNGNALLGKADKAKLGAGFVLAGVVAFVLTGIARSRWNRGSVGRLVSRGMLDEDREGKDPYNKMFKNINTVKVQPLSRDKIEEARRRRAGSVAMGQGSNKEKDSLKDFSIPDNHPWAEKKDVSSDDEELIKARLAVKRGFPLETLEEDDQKERPGETKSE